MSDSASASSPHDRPGQNKSQQVNAGTNLVRIGTQTIRPGDSYFHLVHGSWRRLLVVFGFTFLVLNSAFALLYMLDPQSVAGTGDRLGFADAFFFSVQTMCTIGYGQLSPANSYSNVIVTIEAGFSLLTTAVLTGVVFAKASRATARIRWSRSMLVSRLYGERVLMFRVGNERGNEVADATIHVTALIDETSPEGHRIRRLHDLSLARTRTPIFSMSWLVMHRLDDASPLVGLNVETQYKNFSSIIVTLLGYDSTYGQNVYSRWIYQPEDVLFEHRFADVIETLPDGRVQVDYRRFDDVIPEAPEPKNPGQEV